MEVAVWDTFVRIHTAENEHFLPAQEILLYPDSCGLQ